MEVLYGSPSLNLTVNELTPGATPTSTPTLHTPAWANQPSTEVSFASEPIASPFHINQSSGVRQIAPLMGLITAFGFFFCLSFLNVRRITTEHMYSKQNMAMMWSLADLPSLPGGAEAVLPVHQTRLRKLEFWFAVSLLAAVLVLEICSIH